MGKTTNPKPAHKEGKPKRGGNKGAGGNEREGDLGSKWGIKAGDFKG